MHTLTVWAAQYLLWVMVVGYALVFFLDERDRGRAEMAAQAAVGIVLALVVLYFAKSMHHDPRPFVQNPQITPWFKHGPDDGFPSDHSIAAGLIAMLVLWRHRMAGAALMIAAVLLAWARVAAHVHHLQDVVAGLLLDLLAAVIGHIAVALALNHVKRVGVPQADDVRP